MWLLSPEVFSLLRRAILGGFTPTAEQQVDFEARRFSATSDSGPDILTIVGNNAEIEVTGVLTKTPNFLAWLFGGGNTTYTDINAAIAIAEQDPAVDNITLRIDSPGGNVNGLFETIDTIRAATKPTTSLVTGQAASAAYGIASAADKIVAANRAAMVGSIGVVAGIRLDETVVEITSTEAPKKRPDVTTEEGKAVIREELDAIHSLFAEAIAEGRGISVADVNANYGQGATFVARDAFKRGMIDSVADGPLRVISTPASNGGEEKGAKVMDLAQLKAEHPALFAEAVKVGCTEERDRVLAHLTMGTASGDMKIALTAIKDGSSMTAALQADYLAAGMNRQTIADTTADTAAAVAAVDGATATTDADRDKIASENLLKKAAEACGVEV